MRTTEPILPDRRGSSDGGSLLYPMNQYRTALALLGYVLLGMASFVGAFLLRFDAEIPLGEERRMWMALPLALLLKALAVSYFRLPSDLPRYLGMDELLRILKAATSSSMLLIVGVLMAVGPAFPRSVFLVDYLLTVCLYGGVRLSGVLWKEVVRPTPAAGPGRRTLILGAGDTGELAMRTIKKEFFGVLSLVGFLDDDPAKRGMRLHGYPILGALSDAPRLIKELAITQILIAIPSATKEMTRRIVEQCSSHNVNFQILPTFRDYITGNVHAHKIRGVRVEDLLGREPITLDEAAVSQELAGKRVLVTGAGGSIGSELVRQIARCKPSELVLLDTAETALFNIDNELKTLAPDIRRVPVFADIKHGDWVSRIFEKYKPERVYHAAAYKHVPMMEAYPVEAVFNNVLGTRNLVHAAIRSGVAKFVMISTDKAVRPTSVMGATKRCAELLVAHMNGRGTKFVTVRFGNVLGSAGSVVPIFERQIKQGGPVTVTHPDVTRYFMTIPEAVELVLQAGAMGEGGEVFILDMGQQIRISDLARNMIELSGLEVGKDIELRFTGLRPGEKMQEEIVAPGEQVEQTSIPKVQVHRPANVNHESQYLSELAVLEDAALSGDETRPLQELWALISRHDDLCESPVACKENEP